MDGADDMDDERRHNSGPRTVTVQPRQWRGSRRAFARAETGEARARDREKGDERHGEHRELRPGESDHSESVARNPSRECDGFAPKV